MPHVGGQRPCGAHLSWTSTKQRTPSQVAWPQVVAVNWSWYFHEIKRSNGKATPRWVSPPPAKRSVQIDGIRFDPQRCRSGGLSIKSDRCSVLHSIWRQTFKWIERPSTGRTIIIRWSFKAGWELSQQTHKQGNRARSFEVRVEPLRTTQHLNRVIQVTVRAWLAPVQRCLIRQSFRITSGYRRRPTEYLNSLRKLQSCHFIVFTAHQG